MISICSIWLKSSIPSYSFHSPTAITPLLCPRLHTFISDRVAAQVDFIYGLVDQQRVGEGLQRWHEAKAKWTADSWAFRCSCAELPALSLAVPHVYLLDCQTPRSPAKLGLPLYSTGLNSDLLRPFVSSLSQEHSLHYLFNEKTFKTTYPLRKEDEVPEGAVNLETLETWKFISSSANSQHKKRPKCPS